MLVSAVLSSLNFSTKYFILLSRLMATNVPSSISFILVTSIPQGDLAFSMTSRNFFKSSSQVSVRSWHMNKTQGVEHSMLLYYKKIYEYLGYLETKSDDSSSMTTSASFRIFLLVSTEARISARHSGFSIPKGGQ